MSTPKLPRYDEEAYLAQRPPRLWWIIATLAAGYIPLVILAWADKPRSGLWFGAGLVWGLGWSVILRIQIRRIAKFTYDHWNPDRWG